MHVLASGSPVSYTPSTVHNTFFWRQFLSDIGDSFDPVNVERNFCVHPWVWLLSAGLHGPRDDTYLTTVHNQRTSRIAL
jgi:hypothetical protein